MDLGLSITLKPAYTGDNTLQNEIRSYIRRCIDKMNESREAVSVSDIISLINQPQAYGSYIDYVEFMYLNGTLNQYIGKLSSLENTEDLYVPEWLNIDSTKITDIEFK